MMSPITALALGVPLFAVTNIDDLFVLLAFFSDPRFRPRHVVIGQYAGIGALVLVSLCAALIALVILSSYAGLLGLAPIAIGAKRLVDLARGREKNVGDLARHPGGGAHSQSFAVAAVTIANGADNIGVYVPVFAVHQGIEAATIVAVFALMTALWCSLARWLLHHRTIGGPIRRYGQRILPFVLIGLGVLVMLRAGTFKLLSNTLHFA